MDRTQRQYQHLPPSRASGCASALPYRCFGGGLQTCGMRVESRRPGRISIVSYMHRSNIQSKTYLILTSNNIQIVQAQCTSSGHSSPRHIATSGNAKGLKLVLIPVVKLLMRHIDLPTDGLTSRHLSQSETLHLRLATRA